MREMINSRYLKLGFLYGFLTLVLMALIFKFGIFAAVKLSELLQRGKPLPESELTDSILPPPQLFPLPTATNSASLKVSGYAPPNEKVNIYLNDFNVNTLEVDSEGKFEGEISLALGVSRIYAVSKNIQDQESGPSSVWEIFYEKSPPSLEIIEPEDGSLVRRNENIEIKGKVNTSSKVTVNDHFVILDNEGNFVYPAKLKDGENTFNIVCIDPSNNRTEKALKVFFQK